MGCQGAQFLEQVFHAFKTGFRKADNGFASECNGGVNAVVSAEFSFFDSHSRKVLLISITKVDRVWATILPAVCKVCLFRWWLIVLVITD